MRRYSVHRAYSLGGENLLLKDILALVESGSRLLVLPERGYALVRGAEVRLLAAFDEDSATTLLRGCLAAGDGAESAVEFQPALEPLGQEGGFGAEPSQRLYDLQPDRQDDGVVGKNGKGFGCVAGDLPVGACSRHLLPARLTQQEDRGCRKGKRSWRRSSVWPT